MTSQDVINLYEKYKKSYGQNTYQHISAILAEAKKIHYKDFLKNPTPKGDYEQSWKGFKGNALEKLIKHILGEEIVLMGFKIVSGKKFERTFPKNLSVELQTVKKNLSIDFGQCGFHIPDVDLVIYEPKNFKVVAVLSSKSSLRERIAQSGYWNIKIKNYSLTKHIKVFFVSPDEDGDLSNNIPDWDKLKRSPKQYQEVVMLRELILFCQTLLQKIEAKENVRFNTIIFRKIINFYCAQIKRYV